MIARVPGGHSGIFAKLKGPYVYAYALKCGLTREFLRRLIVMLHCVSSLSHSVIGNSLSQVAMPAIKLVFVGSNRPLYGVDSMHMWWYELVALLVID